MYTTSSPKPTYSLTTSSGKNSKYWEYFYQKIILDYRSDELGKLLYPYNIEFVIVNIDLLDWQKKEAEKVVSIFSNQKDIKLYKVVGPYYIFKNSAHKNRKETMARNILPPYQNIETIPIIRVFLSF